MTTSGNYEIATTKSKENGSKIDKEFFYQGKKEDNDNNIDFSENSNKPFRVGAGKSESSSGGDYWIGDIAEVVVFNQALDSANRNKVESYLALKYGITLIKPEYHSSDGTKVFEKINPYKYDVAGVARDDTSDWNQSISKSINSDAIITISTDTDFTSANTDSRPVLSSEDNRYLVWANNNKGSTWTTNKAPLGGKILKRKWRISKTGDTQHNINIQIDVDDSDFDIDTFSGDLYFAHGERLNHTTLIKMTQNTSDNSKWYVEDINFTDGDLFGFVIALDEPNNQATMVINEVLAIQETTKKDNEEFVEFYVTSGGTLDRLMLSDQDAAGGHQYLFDDTNVQKGEYVVLYIGGGDPAPSSSHSNGIHKYYWGHYPLLNNNNDDVLLLRPSHTDTTEIYVNKAKKSESIFYIPIDYISYSQSKTNAIEGIPNTTSTSRITWDNGPISINNNKLQSFSMTPNGIDSNDANDWEMTTSDTAPSLITVDSNDSDIGGVSFVCSSGANNNAMPKMSIIKQSIVIDDPINGTVHPKRIPGATIRYCFTVDNTGDGIAEDATVSDILTGGGRDKLQYSKSGSIVQDITNECNCSGISTTNGTISNKNITIDFGDINGTGDTVHSRGCGYIEVLIQ